MVKRLKFIAIVGTNASFSFNRLLLNYMQERYRDLAEIEVQEIKDIPLFNEDMMSSPPKCVLELIDKVTEADGVIFATPEYDHAVPAALKSVLEWLSSVAHPLLHKPVMIVGGSYGVQGTVRAQINLRQILDAPGVMADILPANEFMLGTVKDKLDKEGITHEKTAEFLDQCFGNYISFVKDHIMCQAKLLTKEEV
ncbi:fumarate reductase, flavoprotein subunit precursor [Liquorilactobacillus sucicola DSM 21376 = JCM 15457]|uniref:Flavin oxidoreductase n=1 Tax=Liquorilactobacillus sucicola DSM 21376 = JCM 15457 TaxID=1423806 RepID=A0A023CXV4_9LACO|nr:NADPH-dependent FMN reductase [Liquorilactobacillus sucicola]KRN07652.1 flavin oxidoreductase [Liquorilactobacillus sucicola DSM 21376 = JCM 15457]GAJ26713.1 fumarate reductase, flavoprotein subunit precursor [Liquorilactobacillus sucicola DSM 21376 = JCM 15457]